MAADPITYLRDAILAQLCYQFFITPIHMPLDKQYKDFAKLACEFFEGKRSEVIHQNHPRHSVLHRFKPKNASIKKVLITHGWMSRAAYMVKLIKALHKEGFDVYALDFPAHGDSNGYQLPWTDAVAVIRETINEHGPFYALIGHSFGGSMILNTLNLSGQVPKLQLTSSPEKAVLIASPTCMRSPVKTLAKLFRLSGTGYLQLRQLIRQQAEIDTRLVRLHRYLSQNPNTPFLCIHGELDSTVHPNESIGFCNKYKNSHLSILPEADHISVLMDERVEHLVCEFLA